MTQSIQARLHQEEDAARRPEVVEQGLRLPQPRLLDTCVVENLDSIDRHIESKGTLTWEQAVVSELTPKYEPELAIDLIDLGTPPFKELEDRGGYACPFALEPSQKQVGMVDPMGSD